ncbi:MAG: two-component system, chemotaxis family, sensor kinase CheA [Candidatus Eremiobacteraeota bacterium]|nr:two-component system, chemotaxis family, sensor kinase CheA [Candidatus Eremiobacteraeota bacterium]
MPADDFFDRSEFVQYFRDETDELLNSIDADLLRLEQFVDTGTIDGEIVNALFRALHTIKGSAGMLEFWAVQQVAHKLENVYDLLRKDHMPLTESGVNLLFEGRDVLTALVRAAVSGEEAPSGVDEYVERLDAFAGVYDSTAQAIEGPRSENDQEEDLTPVDDAQLSAFEAEVARLLAQAQARQAYSDAVSAPPAHDAPAVQAAPAVDVDAAQAAVDALFTKPAAAQASVAAAGAAPAPFAAAFEPKAAQPETQRVAPTPSAPAAANGTSAAGASAPDAKRVVSAKNQTIRVDIERLDMLLNLVGELVINRTRISDIAATLGRELGSNGRAEKGRTDNGLSNLAKDLSESSALLARTTNEIQESIMKVRMVPIGQVFDRFPRMVRDLAKARGKDIHLEIAGAETDLDKTIVDEVGEPLMHLVRNCVDHGIEPPDVREERGKPRHGTIKLNAYHEGNQVIVEISDDGGGIDLQRVREKAIRIGVIDEGARLSDREIIELIFTPGFSTADQVTDVSGRGVGMDVVKKNILRLKGVFDVDSVHGEGTKFTMKLPLTLAIIQALLVNVAQELYSIPLDSVIESQRIDASDVRTVHGGEVITLRGQVVPLIRIAEFFRLDAPRDPDKVMIVIVGLQGRQVGLVVDSFQGEQEIVIKPLSDVIGRIAGISGATILGNGSISLIIDVHSLVATAYGSGRVTRAEFSGV